MKLYLFIAAIVAILATAPSFAAEPTKPVAQKKAEKKEVKKHKKLEGTKVPEKK